MQPVQRSVPHSAGAAAAQTDVPQGSARFRDGAARRRHEGSGSGAEVVSTRHPPLLDPLAAGQLVRGCVRSTDRFHGQRSQPCDQQPCRSRSLQRPLHGTGQGSAIKVSSVPVRFCFYFYRFASIFRSL